MKNIKVTPLDLHDCVKVIIQASLYLSHISSS